MNNLTYKTAIVTGASSGIGKSIAIKLSENGIKVYAFARDDSKLKSAQKSLPVKMRSNFIPVVCSIGNRGKVEKRIRDITKNDSIDLLINNAGIGFSEKFARFTDAQIDEVIQTNLLGTINMTQSLIATQEVEDRSLHIVVVTSLAGKIGFPNLSVYSATKFALEGLVESLRVEYADSSIRFTVLRPGITDTEFFEKAGMQSYKKSVRGFKNFYSPDKVASIFLANLKLNKKTIVIGNDKIFLKVLPFIPFSLRFKILNLINKI